MFKLLKYSINNMYILYMYYVSKKMSQKRKSQTKTINEKSKPKMKITNEKLKPKKESLFF